LMAGVGLFSTHQIAFYADYRHISSHSYFDSHFKPPAFYLWPTFNLF
jgi:hypothetical protein